MRNEADAQISIKSCYQGPYVGLRPYERQDRELFFGRDRDALFLSDKIFSARLTLLYSPSGLGKSSLLHTLVIPRLEEEHARVIFFDVWSGEHPTDSLKTAIIKLAYELGIPDADAGAPTLTELLRMVASVDKKTLVLVIDQFEEFLISHGQRLEPLRTELGEVARASGLDIHIVISLRQEFLAALEPFRNEILDLFKSTYRLEHLNNKAVRDAIQLPVLLFGAAYKPELVEVLIRDLTAKDMLGTTEGTGPAVELPMLQLVCTQLWEETQRRGDSILTLDLYKQLGSARKILDEYVRKVMPHGWLDKRFTARLMKFLAPPSGLKMSYSVGDLAEHMGFKKDRIEAELERLCKLRILRSRKFRTGLRFELQHDAFIKVVTPWRDEVLRRNKRLREAAWVLFGFLIVAILGVVWYIHSGREQLELRANTETPLAELGKMSNEMRNNLIEARLDNAAGYLLWLRKGTEDYLKDLLQRYDYLRPDWYGLDRSAIEFINLPGEGWPIVLRYSSQRPLNEYYFTHTWRLMAKSFAESWGIPVPQRLLLKADPTFPTEMVRLEALGTAPFELDLPSHEDCAFITSKALPPVTMEFLERFLSEWIPIKQAEHGGPWWVVPRWSLPVWKVSGKIATDGSGLPAFLLALEMQKHPNYLLPPQAFELLLERVAKTYPQTVNEARAARGDRLREDLVEWVKSSNALMHLPVILDVLARYPNKTSKDLAIWLDSDLQSSLASLPPTLRGPWKIGPKDAKAQPENEQSTRQVHEAYREVEAWLPNEEPAIRVYIGKALESEFKEGNELNPVLVERLEILRDEIYKQFGIMLPGLLFKDHTWDSSLGEWAFRIKVLNQNELNPDAEAINPKQGAALECLIKELRLRAVGFRIYWLTAESVSQELESMDAALRGWLNKQYSLTDLKLLLRAIINPTLEELEIRAEAQDGVSYEVPPERSLRPLHWLLRSLVFWSMIDDPRDLQQMARRLRNTQSARLEHSAALTVNFIIEKSIAKGIKATESGGLEEAKTDFSKAIQVDPNAAIRSFLATYPGYLHSQLLSNLDQACKDPTNAFLDRSERIDLEDLIGELDLKTNAERMRRLKICLLASYPESYRQKRGDLATDLLTKYGNPEKWRAQEAVWLAKEILSDYEPLSKNSGIQQRAAEFLKSAARRLDINQSYRAFCNLVELCWKPGPRNWCWSLLNELAENDPKGDIPLEYAYQLSYREKREDLERALIWVEKAEKIIENAGADLKPEIRIHKLDTIRFARAKALKGLASLGDEYRWAQAEKIFSDLLNSPNWGEYSHVELTDLLVNLKRFEEADSILDNAMKKWPRNADLHIKNFWADLLRGNIDEAFDLADKIVDRAGRTDGTLLVTALGHIITGRGKWEHKGRVFLETGHPYVDLITMMLYAFMAGRMKEEAMQLLEKRWAKINPNTWPVRLQGGDEKAWREMLLGYYVYKVGRSKFKVGKSEIFDVLEGDAAFAKSDLSHLPLPRRGMICEAYFYDALLAQAEGKIARMRSSLDKVLDTGHRTYWEYKMAKYLLEHIEHKAGLYK